MKPLMDKRQLAEHFGVPVSWVEKQTAARALPIIRLGKYIRYDREAVAAYLADRTEMPASPAAPVAALTRGPRKPLGPVIPQRKANAA